MESITAKYLSCDAVVLMQDFYLNQASFAVKEKKISLSLSLSLSRLLFLDLLQEEPSRLSTASCCPSPSRCEKTHRMSRYQ